MCGIIGWCGKKNVIHNVNLGLKNLEYRGYDSAGIAFFKNNKLLSIKNVGMVDDLFNKKEVKALNASICIGHTRWATHGKATVNNCHPHISYDGQIMLVHNGIIENYLEIKNKYLQSIKLYGETDTEVVANLFAKIYKKTKNKIDTFVEVIKIIKGSFAFAVLFKDDAKHIYFAKRNSPLVLGLGNNKNCISSDVIGFSNNINSYIEIGENEFGCLSDNNYQLYNNLGSIIKKKIIQVKKTTNPNDDNKYSHYMIKEIYEIPFALINTCEFYIKNFKTLALNYFNNVKNIKLIACGTSYHASLIGEKLFREIGFNANAEIASEFIYNKQIWQKNTLYIFISQSGETADTITAAKQAKNHHAKTLCITNVASSTLTKICKITLPIICGNEIAVASTKAFNAQVLSLLILQKSLIQCSKNKRYKLFLNKTKTKLENIFKQNDIDYYTNQIKILVPIVSQTANIFFVGKNYDYVTALEGALKLKEITYKNCSAYPSGELKHGTISLVDENSLTFAFITEKNIKDKTLNVLNQIKARGGKIVLISQFDEIQNNNTYDYFIKLPKIDDIFYNIISIIPIQLLSFYVSVNLGYNPDKPRNLAKSVTVE